MNIHRRYTLLLALLLPHLEPLVESAGADTIDLAETLARRGKITETQAREQISRIVEVITAELKTGNTVEIERFGSFSVIERNMRRTTDSRRESSRRLPARRSTRFRAADRLRAELNP